jgi:hypothetical protein
MSTLEEQKKITQNFLESLEMMKLECITRMQLIQTDKLKEIEQKQLEEQKQIEEQRQIEEQKQLEEQRQIEEQKQLESKKRRFTISQEPKRRKVNNPEDSEQHVETEEQPSNTVTLDHIHPYSDEEMKNWSDGKKNAWDNRDQNQNRYLYFFNDDGYEAKYGAWTKDETELFARMIKKREDKTWGIFSKNIPGRNGQQCCTFYNKNKDIF